MEIRKTFLILKIIPRVDNYPACLYKAEKIYYGRLNHTGAEKLFFTI
jgi:hypothetical protein